MATHLHTAEDLIRTFRNDLVGRLERARTIAAALPHLPEANRAALVEIMEDTEELGAAAAALDVALLELAKPMQPVRDDLRG